MNGLRAENLAKTYSSTRESVQVFSEVSFEIELGERVALVGESGAGKSTLLHLLAALDTPTDGGIYFSECLLSAFSSLERARYRNENVGFVWQSHNLLPEFTALENVMMPQLIGGVDPAKARKEASRLLEENGLGHHGQRRVGELSGGEQHRVSLARALAQKPTLLLADEPTGNLDFRTASRVMEALERTHTTRRFISIFATHNLELARRCHRVLRLANGKLTELQVSQLGTEAP